MDRQRQNFVCGISLLHCVRREILLLVGHQRKHADRRNLGPGAGGVLQSHHPHLWGHGMHVATTHRDDDLQGTIERSRALMQAHDELLLTLLVEAQLVVVAHTHADEPFPQLITVHRNVKYKIRVKIDTFKSLHRTFLLQMCGLHSSSGVVHGGLEGWLCFLLVG